MVNNLAEPQNCMKKNSGEDRKGPRTKKGFSMTFCGASSSHGDGSRFGWEGGDLALMSSLHDSSVEL